MKKIKIALLFLFVLLNQTEAKVYNKNGYIINIKKDKVYLKNTKTDREKKIKLNLSKGIMMPKTKNKKKATKDGYLRDKNKYWELYAKKYPNELSVKNKLRIKKGKSPVVDSKWEKFHRDHKAFRGQKLEHHHMGHKGYAVPLPEKLHRGKGNSSFFHNKSKKGKKYKTRRR